MHFDFYSLLANPAFLTMATVVLGLWLGDWHRLGRCRLGVSGPLFVGLVLGWLVHVHALGLEEGAAGYRAMRRGIETGIVPGNMQTLVLVLFIAAMGLLASADLPVILRRYGLQFVAMGVAVTLLGASLSYLTAKMIPAVTNYTASGIYTGALTSSPGLAAALEASGKHAAALAESYPRLDPERRARMVRTFPGLAEPGTVPDRLTSDQQRLIVDRATGDVGAGYAVAYPFGVISVILGLMLIPWLFRINLPDEFAAHRNEMAHLKGAAGPAKDPGAVHFDLKAYALVCVLGYFLGTVEIELGDLGVVSLGATGGVLMTSIFCGSLGRLGSFRFRMNASTLGTLRDLTLGCYLGMVGLTYGYRVFLALRHSGAIIALSSLVIGILCVLLGFIIGRKLFGLNWIMLSGAICGGMTSTPGLGVAVNMLGSDEPGAGYAATYPSALAGMVIFTILMYGLP